VDDTAGRPLKSGQIRSLAARIPSHITRASKSFERPLTVAEKVLTAPLH